MKKKTKDLIFISRIKRDGSGTVPVDSVQPEKSLLEGATLKLFRLSISEETYIACGFNSYVVKLKKADE